MWSLETSPRLQRNFWICSALPPLSTGAARHEILGFFGREFPPAKFVIGFFPPPGPVLQVLGNSGS
ncbi:hypothetical protein SLEP1_g14340 [Rubroshorea leprosula]|uniref:Uncharacterized protein n=1 Tax=Rubroshorea leprosula TaxID=152421 RepID=A0AAV5IRM7_9ROSI|nr:hypothetical protein SLEP1_g14340 [Rubroshorea leprosula]